MQPHPPLLQPEALHRPTAIAQRAMREEPVPLGVKISTRSRGAWATSDNAGALKLKLFPMGNGDLSTVFGWWFQPLWKILISWDYYSQYMQN